MRAHPLTRLFALVLLAAAALVACESTPEDTGPTIPGFQNIQWPNPPVYLPADGESEVEMIVTIFTTEGQRVRNVAVTFYASGGGTLENTTVATDASGEATNYLIADLITNGVDRTVTVTAAITDTSGAVVIPKTNQTVMVERPPADAIAIVSAAPLTDEEANARVHAVMLERAQERASARRRGLQGLLGAPEGGAGAGGQAAEATQLTVYMEAIEVTILSDKTSLTADGISKANLQVRVRTITTGKAQTSRQIDFTAAQGLITPAAYTNQFGIANAELTSVVSTAAGDTVNAQFVPGLVAQLIQPYVQPVLTIFAEDANIPADGDAETFLRARLLGPDGTPVVGAKITFSMVAPADASLADQGTGRTNADGEAFAVLKAGQTPGTATVTAAFSSLSANTAVELRDLVLTASAQPTGIVANGQNTSQISVLVTEAITNTAVPGVSVQFSTTLGSIPPTATTNASGVANAVLTAGTAAGPATVTATLGTRTANTTVDLIANTLSISLNSGSSTGSILRDGLDKTTITVTVQDPDGKFLANRTVSWSLATVGGAVPKIFPATGQTSGDGTHTTTLTSDSGAIDDSTTVTVDVGGVTQNIGIDLRGITLTPLGVLPDTILANGSDDALFRWQATETTTGVLIRSHDILITKVSGPGVVLSGVSETTSSGGLATATATATSAAGALVMQAKMGGITDNQTLEILADQLSVNLTTSDPILLRDGSEEATLTAEVIDRFGDPVPSQRVDFSLVGDGALDKTSARTDATGKAQVTLTTDIGTTNSSAQVTADAAGVTDVVTVSLSGVQLSISLNPSRIIANGIETSTITAKLKETGSNSPLPGRTIYFAVTPGSFASINATGDTDDQGAAIVTVRADTTASLTASVTARLGEDPATAISASANLAIEGAPTTAASIALTATTTDLQVKGTGGTETSTITATLLGSNNLPVAPGRSVQFDLSPAGAGTFPNGTGTQTVLTGADGEAEIQFQSGTIATDVTITALDFAGTVSSTASLLTVSSGPTQEIDVSAVVMNFGDSGLYERQLHALLTDAYGNAVQNANVVWTAEPDSTGSIIATSQSDENGVASTYYTYARGFEVDAHSFYATNQGVTDTLNVGQGSLSLVAASSSILADGVSTTDVTATIVDYYGTPVTLVGIGFAVTAGSGSMLAAGVGVDDNGEATNTYISGASAIDGSGTVTVSFRFLNDSVVIANRGVTITASASPDTLSANGMATSTVTATLKETTANVALAGRAVSFSTDVGTVGGSANTDAQGVAPVTFTAGTATGTATITAGYGGLSTTTPIELITSSSVAIALESTETELQVLGTGGVETSMITATVWDAQGNLVPAGTSVTLTASTGTFSNGQVTVTKLTNGSGQVTAAYQSGTTSGTVTFAATSGTASGSAALLTIRSGPATQILVSYDSAAVPTPVDGLISIQISALASDAYGNTVEDGTQIFFDLTLLGANLAAITPSEVTADGVAKATLTYPDTNSGLAVTIQASTLGGTITGMLAILALP